MNDQQAIETKTLSLLDFSLKEMSVPNGSYYFGIEGDEKRLNDKFCLLKSKDGLWLIFYIERGSVSQKSLHNDLNDAMVYFFWKMTKKDTPCDFREKWEQETGLSF